MVIQRISEPNESNGHSQNPKDSFILKAMEEEFGYVASHASLAHITNYYEIHGRNII